MGRATNEQCIPFHVALWSSSVWCFFWIVLYPVWQDIEQHFDWFLFVNLHLKSVPSALVNFQRLAWYLLVVICVIGGVRKYFTHTQSRNKVALYLFEVIEWAVVMYNVVLLVALVVKGQALLTLFWVSLPLELAFLLRHLWFLLLLLPPLAVISSVTIFYFGWLHKTLNNCLRRNKLKSVYLSEVFKSPFLQIVIFAVVTLLYYLLVWLGLTATIHWVCQACPQGGSPLPRKPLLSAHRGCAFLAPENTLYAFSKSAEFPQVAILETDVQISRDGILFLLHDSTLLRTTDMENKCSSVDPFINASELNFYSRACPLSSLNVGRWFAKNMEDVSEESKVVRNQSLPLLVDFLKLAVISDKIILFDFKELPDSHPHASNLVNATLKAINEVGMLHEKVWWLPEIGRDYVLKNYPRMIQATKTEHTPFEEFEEKHIRIVNDAWTLPLDTWRQYQASNPNLTLNMFWVDTTMMLEYAWCIGINSVTTDNCKELSDHNENHLFLVCLYLNSVLEQFLLPAIVLCMAVTCVIIIAYLSGYKIKLKSIGGYLQRVEE